MRTIILLSVLLRRCGLNVNWLLDAREAKRRKEPLSIYPERQKAIEKNRREEHN